MTANPTEADETETEQTNLGDYVVAETATTEDDAHDLLGALDEGDRVRFDGDRWKVTATTESDSGTPFVTFLAETGYHPGKTTLSPTGFQGVVAQKSRGIGARYGRIERLELPVTDGGEDVETESPIVTSIDDVEVGDHVRVETTNGATEFEGDVAAVEPDVGEGGRLNAVYYGPTSIESADVIFLSDGTVSWARATGSCVLRVEREVAADGGRETETCSWCDDPLSDPVEADGDIVRVIGGGDQELAAFHGGICYDQASQYGWE